jgi:hypothetical protein
MATTSIGVLYSTAIPGYADSADIQAALRAYHYGSYAYDPANTSTASLVNPSMAYTLNDLQDQIDNIDLAGAIEETIFTAKGQIISASATSTPSVLSIGSNNQFLIANSATATGLQWTNTLSSPTISSPTITNPIVTGLFLNDSSIVFEGSSADANETTLSVTNPTADRTVTIPDASGNVVLDTAVQTLTNKTLTTPVATIGFTADATTSYTFVLTDANNLVTLNNAGAVALKIPTDASVAFPTGTVINFQQIGAGQVTVSAVSSGTTTITSSGATSASPKTRTRYSAGSCIKTAANTWTVVGDLS